MTSPAALRFLCLHAQHNVTEWRWYWAFCMLRAFAGRRSATVWRDDLEALVNAGLMERGHGSQVRLTDAGRERAAQTQEPAT